MEEVTYPVLHQKQGREVKRAPENSEFTIESPNTVGIKHLLRSKRKRATTPDNSNSSDNADPQSPLLR